MALENNYLLFDNQWHCFKMYVEVIEDNVAVHEVENQVIVDVLLNWSVPTAIKQCSGRHFA